MEQGIGIKTSRVGATGNVTMVRVQGFVDTNTCLELRKTISQIIEQGQFNLVIDLGAVNYVSSAGWGVFVGEIRNIRENGGDLRIVQMMPDVYEVFEMLEFNRILAYYDNIEESINDFDVMLGFDITKSRTLKPVHSGANSTALPKVMRENVMPAEKGGKDLKNRKGLAKPKVNESMMPLVEKIRMIIIDNPLANIFQIRKSLNTRRFGFVQIGPIKLYQLLKKNNWETEIKRIRFYRSR
jgi:anti-sigma B factor antagonist